MKAYIRKWFEESYRRRRRINLYRYTRKTNSIKAQMWKCLWLVRRMPKNTYAKRMFWLNEGGKDSRLIKKEMLNWRCGGCKRQRNWNPLRLYNIGMYFLVTHSRLQCFTLGCHFTRILKRLSSFLGLAFLFFTTSPSSLSSLIFSRPA